MVELITVIITFASTIFAWHKARQKSQQEALHRQSELQLAEIKARSEAEASTDDLMRAHLEMQKMLLASNSEALERSLAQLILSQEMGQARLLETFKNEMEATRHEMATSNHDSLSILQRVQADVRTIPAETVRLSNESFKQIPENTTAIINPKLDGIKAALERRIAELEKRLSDAIDPGAHNARQIIMGDLKATRQTITAMLTRLADIESTLNKLVPPPDPPLGPVALVVPTEDPEDETEDEPNEGEALKPAA